MYFYKTNLFFLSFAILLLSFPFLYLSQGLFVHDMLLINIGIKMYSVIYIDISGICKELLTARSLNIQTVEICNFCNDSFKIRFIHDDNHRHIKYIDGKATTRYIR